MKKNLLLAAALLSFAFNTRAQITGSDTTCAGFIYTYNANIAGADSFAWTIPPGWYVLSGAGTSQVQLLCNQNVGQICASGFDTAGLYINQYCLTVTWGDGGLGWNVQTNPLSMCQCPAYAALPVPNGTGGGCFGCGGGTPSPNITYFIYDNPWPGGAWWGYADGVYGIGAPMVATTYYVYQVDITFGINNPILIEGGACPGTVNNTFVLYPCNYINLGIVATPDPVCIGDTLSLQYDGNWGSYNSYDWSAWQGNVTLLPPAGLDHIQCIVNSSGTIEIRLLCFDMNNCPYQGSLFPNYLNCNAQLTGDTVVCSGNNYTYTANIAGAVTYNWTLPSGWYGLIGQGTSTITATCNLNAGNVCVEGLDGNLNSLGTQCITTQFGGGGSAGWDVQPSTLGACPGFGAPVVASLSSNGTGGGTCPAGCGNGTSQPNIIYGLYDNAIPYAHFFGVVDGVNSILLPPPFPVATYYVLQVDTTLGSDFPDAVLISGGCGSAVINNTITIQEVFPLNPVFIQSPDPACVGDTVIITQVGNAFNNSWNPIIGLFINNFITQEQVEVVITSDPAAIEYIGFDQTSLCPLDFGYTVNINSNCAAPTAGFTSTMNPICPGTCTGFTNLSVNANSYLWSFAGATLNSSTDANPVNICYNTPGSYDVSLIATNTLGSDTLTLSNYITVLPYPPSQSIVQNGDTLVANAGFATYQWYYNGTLITGATNSFYVATQNGDYNVISTDANGCEVEAAIFNVVTSAQFEVWSVGFEVYPNPVEEKLYVKSNMLNGVASVITIYNMIGVAVQQEAGSKKPETIIDVSALAKGIYWLEVSEGTKTFRSKFVKE